MALFRRRNAVETRDPDPFPPWNPPIWNQTLTGVQVTEEATLGLVTVYRCVDLIASTIGSLSVHVYRDGERVRPTPQLVERPNYLESRVDTFSALITSALMRGNGFALLGDYDRFGHPRQMVVLNPDAVQVRVNADTGAVSYSVGQDTYTADEMLHLRGFVRPGHVVGAGVLDLHKHALGLAIAEHEYTERIFSEGSIPSGVISTDADITPDAANELKRAWVNSHGGRDRTPAVLSGGLKYSPIQLSNSDLELLSARKWSATQIAAMFGVPAHLAGAPSESSLTYSTTTEDARAFVRFGLRPHIVRLEQALTRALPRGQAASIALGDYLQPDLLTRMQAAQIAIEAGIKTVEEVRAEEGIT
jgi:HK97 family phage portal protein